MSGFEDLKAFHKEIKDTDEKFNKEEVKNNPSLKEDLVENCKDLLAEYYKTFFDDKSSNPDIFNFYEEKPEYKEFKEELKMILAELFALAYDGDIDTEERFFENKDKYLQALQEYEKQAQESYFKISGNYPGSNQVTIQILNKVEQETYQTIHYPEDSLGINNPGYNPLEGKRVIQQEGLFNEDKIFGSQEGDYYRVFDINGRKVPGISINKIDTDVDEKLVIDTSLLPPGIYYVHDKRRPYAAKIIKL